MAASFGLLSGLLVDAVIAAIYGAGAQTDAFFVGARLPLLLATMLLIAANQALLPVFSSWLVTRQSPMWGSMGASIVWLAVVGGAAIAALVTFVATPLCAALAPGLSDETTALAAQVLSVMAFTVPFAAGSEVLRAFLNARRAFVTPALVNVALNLSIITVILMSGRGNVVVVAWGYVAGGALRMLLLLCMSCRRGLSGNPLPGLRSRDTWKALRLCRRPLTGAGLAPVVRLVEQMLISHLPPGAVSLLNYGYRLVAGMGGTVLFRSVIVTLVPRLTEAVERGQSALARELTGLGVRLMLLVSVPLATFIVLVAEPGVRLLFERGRFGAEDAVLLASLIALLAASMPADAVNRAQMAPYFSHRNTRVPFRNTLTGMAVNLVLLPLALLPDDSGAVLHSVAAAYVLSRWFTVLTAQHRLRCDDLAPQARVRRTLQVLLTPLLLASSSMIAVGLLVDLYDTPPGVSLAGWLVTDIVIGVTALAGTLRIRRRHSTDLLQLSLSAAPPAAHVHSSEGSAG